MDHLVCFVPGMLALGAHGETYDADMELARELMATCYRMYAHSPSGLAPEIADFSHAREVRAVPSAKHGLLRPETVESLFLMWRVRAVCPIAAAAATDAHSAVHTAATAADVRLVAPSRAIAHPRVRGAAHGRQHVP